MFGVTVTVKNKPISTLSNLNENYIITAISTEVLVFSYIGYKTAKIPINGQQTIDLLMQEQKTFP